MIDHNLIQPDCPKSADRPNYGPVRNPHLTAIWNVNGHGIANDDSELPLLDLISPPLISPTKPTPTQPANQVGAYENWVYENVRSEIQKRTCTERKSKVDQNGTFSYEPNQGTEKLFSDEDESILTENDKNIISNAINRMDSNTVVSTLDIIQDDVIDDVTNDVINDSNEISGMEISIHGNSTNQNSRENLESNSEPKISVLAITYKETKEVQTSHSVTNVTEVGTQVISHD